MKKTPTVREEILVELSSVDFQRIACLTYLNGVQKFNFDNLYRNINSKIAFVFETMNC